MCVLGRFFQKIGEGHYKLLPGFALVVPEKRHVMWIENDAILVQIAHKIVASEHFHDSDKLVAVVVTMEERLLWVGRVRLVYLETREEKKGGKEREGKKMEHDTLCGRLSQQTCNQDSTCRASSHSPLSQQAVQAPF